MTFDREPKFYPLVVEVCHCRFSQEARLLPAATADLLLPVPAERQQKLIRGRNGNGGFVFLCPAGRSGVGRPKHRRRIIRLRFHHRRDEIQLQRRWNMKRLPSSSSRRLFSGVFLLLRPLIARIASLFCNLGLQSLERDEFSGRLKPLFSFVFLLLRPSLARNGEAHGS